MSADSLILPDMTVPPTIKVHNDAHKYFESIKDDKSLFGFIKFFVVLPTNKLPFFPLRKQDRLIWTTCCTCSKHDPSFVLYNCKENHSDLQRGFFVTCYLSDLQFALNNIDIKILHICQIITFRGKKCIELNALCNHLYNWKKYELDPFNRCFLKMLALRYF